MKAMDFLKGMGAGMMVGAALGMIIAPDKRSGKKTPRQDDPRRR